jgi:hypothetical protein
VNAPLLAGEPIDPNSSTMVRELASEVESRGAAVNHSCWSTPVWQVKRRQARVRVAADNPALDRQFARVPLPRAARAACGQDAQLTVWQPSTDTLWEFFGFRRDTTGAPRATFGGRIRGVSHNPGHFTDDPGPGFGATATSIPLLAGLQRIAELRAGRIDHAVAFAMRRPAACFRWPAQRQDGDRHRSNALAPPEGARLRLPASLDLESLGLTPYGLVLARAVQRYGMVLRDRASLPVLYAEAPRRDGSHPYAAIFGDRPANQDTVLRNFPWNKLQVLAPAPGAGNCGGGGVLPPLLPPLSR